MGRAIWGTSGGFQGKNGANIGRWVGGQNVVGPLPHPSLTPPSVPQLNQRAKFGLMITFLSWISPIIRVGFQNEHKEKQSAFNAAFVYNFRNAILGSSAANYTIDYPELLLSKGKLSKPDSAAMATTEDAQLDLTWTAYFQVGYGAATDKATFVVYNPAKGDFVTRVGAVVRSALSYDFVLPVSFSGDMVHVYMSFVSESGRVVSDSVYVGSTVVQ
ncbi:MAG: DUF6266 family protein [Bacteroidota bacterium]